MLEEFFAVTQTSVYQIQAEKDGKPSLVKIALRGKSKVSVGGNLNTETGDMVSVGKQIIVYIPEKYGMMHPLCGFERNISKINYCFWKGNSSYVTALFKTEKEAMACFSKPDLKPCDPRWLEKTKKVLEEIGDNHPVFFIPHDDLALIQ